MALVIIEKTYCNFDLNLTRSNGSLPRKRRFGSLARDRKHERCALHRYATTFMFLISLLFDKQRNLSVKKNFLEKNLSIYSITDAFSK